MVVSLQFRILLDRPDFVVQELVGGIVNQIVCDSVIETVHVHYGPFLLFLYSLLQGFKSWFTDLHFMFQSIAVVCTSTDNRDFPLFSLTTLCLRNLSLLCGQVHTAGNVVHG